MLIDDLDYSERVYRDYPILGGIFKSFRHGKVKVFKTIPNVGSAAYKAIYTAFASGSWKARTSGYSRGYITRIGHGIAAGSSSASWSEAE